MNKLYTIVILFIFFTTIDSITAQTGIKNTSQNTQVLDKLPEFSGGEGALMKYIASNVQYPKLAIEKKISGIVIVSFVVNEKGKVIEAKLTQKVSPCLDKEALRVVNSMPKWKPGEKDNKPVKAIMQIPVNFRMK